MTKAYHDLAAIIGTSGSMHFAYNMATLKVPEPEINLG